MKAPAEHMALDYAKFRALLNTAARRVPPFHFSTPVAGQDDEIVRERNFCYELYHQLRVVFDRQHFALTLGAEIDKSGHPLIRTDVVPDLIVHDPGNMDRNLCVLEVKPITGATAGFRKDLSTLRSFVAEYSYYAGLLFVFGSLPLGEARIRAKIGADFASLRATGIRVLWISKAQAPLVELA